jgi:alkylated DNA repair dioxygenase AlkB
VKLFEDEAAGREEIGEGAMVLRGFARADAEELVREIGRIAEAAPLRRGAERKRALLEREAEE